MYVIVAMHALFTYFFIYDFLWKRVKDILITDVEKALPMVYAGVAYLASLMMAFIALFMLYTVGPGYLTDHFKSVKLEMLGDNISMKSHQSDDVEEV